MQSGDAAVLPGRQDEAHKVHTSASTSPLTTIDSYDCRASLTTCSLHASTATLR